MNTHEHVNEGRAAQDAQPELLICIGAQKAGTTWLEANLRAHPDLHFAPRKEVHYFEVLDGHDPMSYSRNKARLLQSIKNLPDEPGPDFDAAFAEAETNFMHLRMFNNGFEDHTPYLDYLRLGYAGQRYICDFTPAYAHMSRNAFEEMARVVPHSRYLFLMRDPVDRLWSAMRMSARRRASIQSEKGGGIRSAVGLGRAKTAQDLATASAVKFVKQAKRGTMPGRSSYDRTIRDMEGAVGRDNLHYEFFETLFTPEAMKRICDFLGVPTIKAAMDEKENEGAPIAFPKDQLDGFLSRLAPQYNFCAAKFGETALPERWQSRIGRLKELGLFDPTNVQQVG